MKNRVRITKTEVLSDEKYKLKKVFFDFQKKEGEWEHQVREVLDRGNSATILLYNKESKSILLTRQFRLPTYLNGNVGGFLMETCAGLLENEKAEDRIKKEAEEETGFKIPKVKKIFESFMSPGVLTEIIHFFVGEYTSGMKVSEGGGLEEEKENIEVIEMDFEEAYNLFHSGEIKDAKTIMLLQYARINNLFG